MCANKTFLAKKRHQMETFPCYWPVVRGVHRSPVDSPTKARDAELWCFVNSRDAGDLRCHGAHYDKIVMYTLYFYTSKLGNNDQHLGNVIFKGIFRNENYCILIQISLTFIHKGPIDNKSAMFSVMAWRRTGDRLSLTWITDELVPGRTYTLLGLSELNVSNNIIYISQKWCTKYTTRLLTSVIRLKKTPKNKNKTKQK